MIICVTYIDSIFHLLSLSISEFIVSYFFFSARKTFPFLKKIKIFTITCVIMEQILTYEVVS